MVSLTRLRGQTAYLVQQVLQRRRRSLFQSVFVYAAFCNVNATLGKRDAIVIDAMFEMEQPKAFSASELPLRYCLSPAFLASSSPSLSSLPAMPVHLGDEATFSDP